MGKRFIYIVLVIIWANIIFYFSSDIGPASSKKSLEIAQGVYNGIKVLNGNLQIDEGQMNYFIRKMGHVVEYLVLTILILGLLSTTKYSVKYNYWIAWTLSTAYAILDEYHQTFVPGRDGSLRDVAIDSIGIILAIVIYYWGRKVREKLSVPSS